MKYLGIVDSASVVVAVALIVVLLQATSTKAEVEVVDAKLGLTALAPLAATIANSAVNIMEGELSGVLNTLNVQAPANVFCNFAQVQGTTSGVRINPLSNGDISMTAVPDSASPDSGVTFTLTLQGEECIA